MIRKELKKFGAKALLIFFLAYVISPCFGSMTWRKIDFYPDQLDFVNFEKINEEDLVADLLYDLPKIHLNLDINLPGYRSHSLINHLSSPCQLFLDKIKFSILRC